MTKWRSVKDEPPPEGEPIKLLFYSAFAEWRDHETGEIVDISDIVAVRYTIGWWDGSRYREQYTNHDVFEFENKPGDPDLPSHWMPLPSPPERAA